MGKRIKTTLATAAVAVLAVVGGGIALAVPAQASSLMVHAVTAGIENGTNDGETADEQGVEDGTNDGETADDESTEQGVEDGTNDGETNDDGK